MLGKRGLLIQQTKWLHILQQFLGPVVIIILSIAFQCAGALIQMVLWRSIKNNFAHHQAQEGPNLTTGRWAQMPASATPHTHPAFLMWNNLSPWEHSESDTTCQGGERAALVYTCIDTCASSRTRIYTSSGVKLKKKMVFNFWQVKAVFKCKCLKHILSLHKLKCVLHKQEVGNSFKAVDLGSKHLMWFD